MEVHIVGMEVTYVSIFSGKEIDRSSSIVQKKELPPVIEPYLFFLPIPNHFFKLYFAGKYIRICLKMF